MFRITIIFLCFSSIYSLHSLALCIHVYALPKVNPVFNDSCLHALRVSFVGLKLLDTGSLFFGCITYNRHVLIAYQPGGETRNCAIDIKHLQPIALYAWQGQVGLVAKRKVTDTRRVENVVHIPGNDRRRSQARSIQKTPPKYLEKFKFDWDMRKMVGHIPRIRDLLCWQRTNRKFRRAFNDARRNRSCDNVNIVICLTSPGTLQTRKKDSNRPSTMSIYH